jgi:sugar phosphate permease
MTSSPPLSVPPVATRQGYSGLSATRPEIYRWVVLGVAITAQTAAAVTTQGLQALIPFFQQAFHLSLASATLTISAVMIGATLSTLFMGNAVDRYGERIVVGFTMAAMGAATIVAATIDPSYGVLLLILALVGVLNGAVQPGGTRAIVLWFSDKLRGLAMGLRQASLSLGGALGAAMLPLLAIRFGWSAGVLAQGVVAIAGGMIFWLFYRDRSQQQQADSVHVAAPTLRALLRLIIKHTTLRSLMIAGTAMVALQYTFLAHVVLYLTNQLQIPLIDAEFLLALVQTTGIIGRAFLTWLTDKIWPDQRLRTLKWTMLACVAGLIILSWLPAHPPTWLLFVLCAWLGFLGIGYYPLFLIQVAELAPQSAIASTVSVAITLNNVAVALGPPAFGLIVGLTGSYQLGWMVLAGVALVTTNLLRARADPEVSGLG